MGMLLGMAFGLAVTSSVSVGAIGTLPLISILTPVPNQSVSGAVSFYAIADSTGVTSLQFRVDSKNVGPNITAGSCSGTATSASDSSMR